MAILSEISAAIEIISTAIQFAKVGKSKPPISERARKSFRSLYFSNRTIDLIRALSTTENPDDYREISGQIAIKLRDNDDTVQTALGELSEIADMDCLSLDAEQELNAIVAGKISLRGAISEFLHQMETEPAGSRDSQTGILQSDIAILNSSIVDLDKQLGGTILQGSS